MADIILIPSLAILNGVVEGLNVYTFETQLFGPVAGTSREREGEL
jgi:hypothetical protein